MRTTKLSTLLQFFFPFVSTAKVMMLCNRKNGTVVKWNTSL